MNLSGPRMGVTFLSDGVVRKLSDCNIEVGSFVSHSASPAWPLQCHNRRHTEEGFNDENGTLLSGYSGSRVGRVRVPVGAAATGTDG
jgi:hypothetical protein